MGAVARCSRRFLVLASVALLIEGCGTTLPLVTAKAPPLGPRQTIDRYFSLLASGHPEDARRLMTVSFQDRLGAAGVQQLLHSIQTVQVTGFIDAVAWANGLGAHLPGPPADRREYLVTLTIVPSPAGRRAWSAGVNRRFIDLLSQGGSWLIDAIGVRPGVLVTGQPPRPSDQTTLVIPVSPLRLGPAPIDRAIYSARQHAADHGAIPWSTDPIGVVHRDGPSFGLRPDDPAEIVRRDSDPATLVPRVLVLVHQGQRQYLVTVIQPIRPGRGGVWAIADLEPASPVTLRSTR